MNNRLQNRQDCCQKPETRTCGECSSYDQLQMMPLAMAYVPWQQWQNVCEGGKGLAQGSIFEELVLPFHYPSRVCNNNSCRNRTNNAYYVSPMCSTPTPRCHSGRYESEKFNKCERRCD